MSTEKLYYKDSYIKQFEATVTKVGDGFVILSATAFFPTAGGQLCDDGFINGYEVTRVEETDGEILHYTDAVLQEGQSVRCEINFGERMRKMRSHTAEHIVSGIVHSLYGYDNVGFHLSDTVTIDFSGELTQSQIRDIEVLANEKVMSDIPVDIIWPDDEQAETIPFRSKLELDQMKELRLVKIGDTDICACCAPHVARTGEIGCIKLVSADRHRGGVRLTMVAGMDAFKLFAQYQDSVTAISGLLSVPRDSVSESTKLLLEEKDRVKYEKNAIEIKLVQQLPLDSNCVFTNLSAEAQREYCNLLKEKHAIAAVFCGEKYVIGSNAVNLRERTKEINQAINGRGGGSAEMISGIAKADEKTIRDYFLNFL